MTTEQDTLSTSRHDPAARAGRAARMEPGPLAQGEACDSWPHPDGEPRRWSGMLLLIAGVFAILLGPAVVQLVTDPPGPLQLVGTLAVVAVLAVLFVRLFSVRIGVEDDHRAVPWLELGAFIVLAAGLATRGSSWVPALGLATLLAGIHLRTVWSAGVVATLTGLAGVLAWLDSADPAGVVTLMLAAGVMGGFGYMSRRSMVLSAQLRATRQELAGMAVADERLRIARELHDLLGHSLSVITLKAELAGSLLPADPDRARGEISEVETVARRSLGEVREAVTGYRRPTLAAELATARRSLAAAGITCRVHAPADRSLPEDVDSLLAWAVREGATNVIRHSQASTCTLRLLVEGDLASVEVTDDGAGPAAAGGTSGAPAQPQAAATGSGLAGLAERAGRLGGQLDAGPAGERGFRLRVRVPLERPREAGATA